MSELILTRKRSGWGRWLRGALRRGVFGAAVLGTSLALLWAEENWRAARNWAACRRELEAKGERLDFDTFQGPPVSSERNLARQPFFARWGNYQISPVTGRAVFSDQRPARSELNYMPGLMPDRVRSKQALAKYDLLAWQQYYREKLPNSPSLTPARDVLQGLTHFQEVLAELQAVADESPDGIFRRELAATNLGRGGLGSFGVELSYNDALMLRACARLEAGDAHEAMRDIQLGLWLHRATFSEPALLLPLSIGVALVENDHIPIQRGLASRCWTAAELDGLQKHLQSIDLLTDYVHAMRGMRAWNLAAFDAYFQQNNREIDRSRRSQGHWVEQAFILTSIYGPRGWLIQNKAVLCRQYQRSYIDVCDASAHRLYLRRMQAAQAEAHQTQAHPNPCNYLCGEGFHSIESYLSQARDTQVQVDEAVTACALERYALDHGGQYPATLEELTPGYVDRVPPGVVDGQPMRYERTPEGRYRLTARLTDEPGSEYNRGAALDAMYLVWRYPAGGR